MDGICHFDWVTDRKEHMGLLTKNRVSAIGVMDLGYYCRKGILCGDDRMRAHRNVQNIVHIRFRMKGRELALTMRAVVWV